MNFKTFGKEGAPALMLIPGLRVSYEIFLLLVDLLKDRFTIIAVEVAASPLGFIQSSPLLMSRPNK